MYQVAQGIVDTSPTLKYVYAEPKPSRGCDDSTYRGIPLIRALPGEHTPCCTTQQTSGKES